MCESRLFSLKNFKIQSNKNLLDSAMTDYLETPLTAFYKWEKQTPKQVFLRQPIDGVWKSWTYLEAAFEIRRIATAIRSLNFTPQ
jgi:long-subunit acyl-CoA synthetase (AMP-forming)